MSSGASLAFPGSRTLGTWWRQLAERRPQCMWVGYHLFHHIAAPLVVLRPRKLPPLELFVIRAMALDGAASPGTLAARLHLDPAVIGRVLRHLSSEGLVHWAESDTPTLSETGRHAVVKSEYPEHSVERRVLYFWHADWTQPPSSHFADVAQGDHIAWLPAPETPFTLQCLQACVKQDARWKEVHAFPREIRDLATTTEGSGIEAWEHVVVATPQRWFGVVLRTETDNGRRWLGFAVNSRNWEMHAVHKAFEVPEDEPAWFPPPLPQRTLQQAFAEWCLQRQIPASESDQCELKIEGNRLIVQAPAALRERLLSGRGEFWLLAGEGPVRAALRLEFA